MAGTGRARGLHGEGARFRCGQAQCAGRHGDGVRWGTVAPLATTSAGDLQDTVVMPSAEPESAETFALASSPSGSSSGSWWSDLDGRTMPGQPGGHAGVHVAGAGFGAGHRLSIRHLQPGGGGVFAGLRVNCLSRAKAESSCRSTRQVKSRRRRVCARRRRDVSDVILAGLARRPEDRPESAVAFTRRFRNAVDAEFSGAADGSKAFLLQHLGPFIVLVAPIFTIVVSVAALLSTVLGKLVPLAALRMALVPLAAAGAVCVRQQPAASGGGAGGAGRAGSRATVRGAPCTLAAGEDDADIGGYADARAAVSGAGWVVGDCLWPVLCAVEKLSGRAALERSRELMTGLRSAGRALAIRHLALAVLAVSDVVKSFATSWADRALPPAGRGGEGDVVPDLCVIRGGAIVSLRQDGGGRPRDRCCAWTGRPRCRSRRDRCQ